MLRIHQNWFKKSRLSHLSWLGVAGVVSCFVVVLTFGIMIFPSPPQLVNAEGFTGEATQGSGSGTSTSVGINLPSTIAFDAVTPTASGATTTANENLIVATTNSASYSLYLYSSDGDSSLKSINPANTSTVDAINNGGVGLTLSSLEPNTWGYSLGTSEPTDTTTYSAVPTSNDTPIQTKDTSSTASANDTYTLSFGAKVDTSIPSGTYTGTLTVAVVAEPALVTIAFDGNGATGGSMPNQQIIAGQSANLNTNQYTRDGYDFTGWNTNAGGTGTSYTDGASYTAPSSSAGQTVTLYAQWEEQFVNLLTQATYMQDLTAAQCSGSSDGATATLIDRRDNNSYTIAKINGNCWMTQNLRLSGGRTLTTQDSNVESSWYFPNTSLDVGDSYSDARSVIFSGTSSGYYNYCAASAGTVCSSSTTQSAIYDVCPKGWKLPTNTEFNSIAGTSYISAFRAITGGYYLSGAGTVIRSEGSSDFWWASTAYSNTSQYYLRNSYEEFYTSGAVKSSGYTVRCIRSN